MPKRQASLIAVLGFLVVCFAAGFLAGALGVDPVLLTVVLLLLIGTAAGTRSLTHNR